MRPTSLPKPHFDNFSEQCDAPHEAVRTESTHTGSGVVTPQKNTVLMEDRLHICRLFLQNPSVEESVNQEFRPSKLSQSGLNLSIPYK
jgi:hypothetical protein